MAAKRSRDSDSQISDELEPPAKRSWNIWPFTTSEPQCTAPPKTLAGTIQNSNVGKFQAALKPILKDLGLSDQKELPKIVFCGQESSGKSSTVERAANLPFTPRNQNICTRQPLYLSCKHLPDDGPLDSLVLETPSGPHIISMDSVRNGTLEDKVKEFMFDGPGIDELPIKMTYSSRNVPTMSFCDLPGTIGVTKTGEPLDMKERTVELLQETIEDKHALIVAVVTRDVRNNIALETLQKTPGALARTIVVLAKADTLGDQSYKSKGKADPFWMLKDMLISSPIQGYTGKIYPVVNRDTNSKKRLTLSQVNKREQNWFKKNLSGYNRESECSINAVINAIDQMYSAHMREQWLPEIMATIAVKKGEVEGEIRDLGIPPECVNRTLMYQWFHNCLEVQLRDKVKTFYSMPSNTSSASAVKLAAILNVSDNVKITPHCSMFALSNSRIQLFQSIRDGIPSIATIHTRRFQLAFESAFSHQNYDFNLARFSALKRRCGRKLESTLKKATKSYCLQMNNYIDYFETARIGQPTLELHELYGAELHISVRCFAIPVNQWMLSTDSFKSLFEGVGAQIGDTLVEDCAAMRASYHTRILALDKALGELVILRTI